MDQPLDFVTTAELLEELKKRFDSLLFIGYKDTSDKRSDYHVATNASLHEVIGLAATAVNIAEAAFES